MTHLYLIRHGIATDREPGGEDSQRPLTAEGQVKTQKVAQRLRSLGLDIDLILTSPLVRARQTAEIFVTEFGITCQESALLAPEGSFTDWLAWFRQWQQPNLALIGHEPDLSAWAELLVWGSVKGNIALKKAGVLGITTPERGDPMGNCTLFLVVPPKILLG